MECVSSGFRRQVAENCALLGYYAASNGDLLPTFRDNRSVPSSGIMIILNPEDGTDGLSWNVVRNYHCALHNDPKERSY